MPDRKDNKGKQDRIRVAGSEPYEVEYLHRRHPEFTHEEIKAAIKAAGPIRKDVEEYLQKKKEQR